MKHNTEQVKTLEELFDRWFATMDDIFDDTKGRTPEEIRMDGGRGMKINLLLTKELQLNLLEDEQFVKDTRKYYKLINLDTNYFYSKWVRFSIKKARDKEFLKQKFMEWVKIDFTLRFVIGELTTEKNIFMDLNKDFVNPELAKSNEMLRLRKIVTKQSLKFMFCLFEQYFIFDNPKFINKDFKYKKGN